MEITYVKIASSIGNVDINNATKATIVRNSATNSVSAQKIPTGGQIVFAEPNIPRAFNQSTVILSSRSNTPENNPIPKIAPTNLENSVPKTNSQSNTPLLNYVGVEPRVIEQGLIESEVMESGVIEFIAPQASNYTPRTDSNSSVVVPSKPYTTTRQSSRYRVVVPVTNNQQRETVLSVVPDAFAKVSQGRTVMQVGVFSTQNKASDMVQILNSRGLRAIIERLN